MDRGIPVNPLFLERVERCKWIQYYISPHQWSDAFDVSLGTRLCELVKAAQKSSSDSGSDIEFMTAMLEEDISRVPQPSKQAGILQGGYSRAKLEGFLRFSRLQGCPGGMHLHE